MNNVTDLLIKHGIEGLILEDDNSFKQNLIQALTMKLNENFKELKLEVSQKLLQSTKITEESEHLNKFVEFIENFKPGNYTFKNASNLNISDSDMEYIKKLFESLNPKNRNLMVSEIFEDKTKFVQTLEFAKKSKNLL
jgi:GR25 family glycosyltransferase involved in LPS biosynthesis